MDSPKKRTKIKSKESPEMRSNIKYLRQRFPNFVDITVLQDANASIHPD